MQSQPPPQSGADSADAATPSSISSETLYLVCILVLLLSCTFSWVERYWDELYGRYRRFRTAPPVVPQENPERLLPSTDGSLPAASVPGGASDTTAVPPVVPALAGAHNSFYSYKRPMQDHFPGQPAGDALNGAQDNPLPGPAESREDEASGSGEAPSTVATGGAEQPTTTQPSPSL